MNYLADIELNRFLLDKIIPRLPTYVRHGNMLAFRCPICGDSKKSLTKKRGALYTSPKISYHCFNCNISLSGIKFLQALVGDSFKDIMTEYKRLSLDSFTTVNKPVDLVEQKEKGPVPEVTPLTEHDLAYLATRKITELPTFESLQLRHVKNEHGDFIFIPWLNHGKLVSFQLHNYTKIKNIPKYKFQKHADKCVYGLDRIDQSFKYILCFEGVYDSLFVKNGVAIGGINLMAQQEAEIRSRYPNHEIVLAFDADSTGISAIKHYIIANATKYKYFIWYDTDTVKFKDINNVIVNNGNINKYATNDIEPMIYGGLEARFELTKNNLW